MIRKLLNNLTDEQLKKGEEFLDEDDIFYKESGIVSSVKEKVISSTITAIWFDDEDENVEKVELCVKRKSEELVRFNASRKR